MCYTAILDPKVDPSTLGFLVGRATARNLLKKASVYFFHSLCGCSLLRKTRKQRSGNMKYILFFTRLLFATSAFAAMLVLPQPAFASSISGELHEAGPSATPSSRSIRQPDNRARKLKTYLVAHSSPLAPYADVFIARADEYGLDWRLVASISGVESTFGKKIPVNSYNAYGWNGGKFYFRNWEDGIETVSRTLATKYAARGANTVWEIGPIYAPPSKTWAGKVAYFMEKIEEGPKVKNAALALELAI